MLSYAGGLYAVGSLRQNMYVVTCTTGLEGWGGSFGKSVKLVGNGKLTFCQLAI
jgi:hypothetical protein